MSVGCGHCMGSSQHSVHMEDSGGKAEVKVSDDGIDNHHSRDHGEAVVAMVSVSESVCLCIPNDGCCVISLTWIFFLETPPGYYSSFDARWIAMSFLWI